MKYKLNIDTLVIEGYTGTEILDLQKEMAILHSNLSKPAYY
jgi:hypothetical protein